MQTNPPSSQFEDQSYFEKARNWVRNSITLRLFTIGFLILLLLIPVSMIEDLIRERQYRQSDAQNQIAEQWGHPQTFSGPVLSVPYTVYNRVYDKDAPDKYKTVTHTEYMHFLPETLQVNGKLLPQTRYRGIFEAVVYTAETNVQGTFRLPDIQDLHVAKDMRWHEAFISMGISDLRSIREQVTLEWNKQSYHFEPGLPCYDIHQTGIHTYIKIEPEKALQEVLSFSLRLTCNGSTFLRVTPLGKTTEVQFTSTWPSPSFEGAFLPVKREITSAGFEANWKVLNLNRSYPQYFAGSMPGINESSFGVTLLLPVDHYQKTMRSAKYAVLFISLTFMVFFFIQVINHIRIHPIQYLLIGFALCLFYTLLLSLSEHIAFTWSYMIASAGIILLISLYAHATFKKWQLTLLLFGILCMLYGFIFTIIRLEDVALLVGSLGLFAALAVLMYVTRNIQWYQQK